MLIVSNFVIKFIIIIIKLLLLLFLLLLLTFPRPPLGPQRTHNLLTFTLTHKASLELAFLQTSPVSFIWHWRTQPHPWPHC